MPCLPLYADKADLKAVLDWLNNEESIAFLVPSGPKKWVAVKELQEWPGPRTAMWHVPSGPLPLLMPHPSKEVLEIENPWEPWTEQRTGANPATPYFGAGHPGVVWFNNRDRPGVISLSSFEWIGNHYRIIGSAADPATEKWWRRLGRRMKRNAVRIPRSGPTDGPNPDIWAHPGALSRINAGATRDPNP